MNDWEILEDKRLLFIATIELHIIVLEIEHKMCNFYKHDFSGLHIFIFKLNPENLILFLIKRLTGCLLHDHNVTKFSKWLINMLTMKMVRNDGIWYGRLWISSEFCLNILQRKISTPAGIKTEKCNQNIFYNFCLQFPYFNMASMAPNK